MLFEDEKFTKGKKEKIGRGRGSSSPQKNEKSEPELVFKVVSNINHSSASNLLDYISRNKDDENEKFVQLEDEFGNQLNSEEVAELAKSWTDEFNADTKKNSRKMTHFVLSVDVPNNKYNEAKFKAATRKLLAERLGKEGYRYTFAVHNDTNNLHAHVVVNNFNKVKSKKLRITTAWLIKSRQVAQSYLAKEGIHQSATTKEERNKLFKDYQQNVNKAKDPNNWYEAKLKINSENDAHYKKLVEQYDIISQVQKDLKVKSPTNENLKLLAELTKLKTGLITKDHYKNRTEANNQYRHVMKKVGVTQEQVDNAKYRRYLSDEKLDYKMKRILKDQAVELVKREIEIKRSDLAGKEKKELLSTIAARKKELSSVGVDVKKISKEQIARSKHNDEYLAVKDKLERSQKTTDRVLKKGDLNPDDSAKRLNRLFEDLHKHKTSDLSNSEKVLLQKQKNALLETYTSNGVDANLIEKKWAAQRQVKDQIKDIKERLEYPLSPDETNKSQAEIIKLKKEAEKVAINQKELYAMRKGLTDSQAKLNKQHENNFLVISNKIDAQLDKLNSMKAKQTPEQAELEKLKGKFEKLTIEHDSLAKEAAKDYKQWKVDKTLTKPELAELKERTDVKYAEAEKLKTKIEVTDNQIQKLQASMTGIEKNNAGHTQNQEQQTDHSSTRAEEKNRLGTAIPEQKEPSIDQQLKTIKKEVHRLYDVMAEHREPYERKKERLASWRDRYSDEVIKSHENQLAKLKAKFEPDLNKVKELNAQADLLNVQRLEKKLQQLKLDREKDKDTPKIRETEHKINVTEYQLKELKDRIPKQQQIQQDDHSRTRAEKDRSGTAIPEQKINSEVEKRKTPEQVELNKLKGEVAKLTIEHDSLAKEAAKDYKQWKVDKTLTKPELAELKERTDVKYAEAEKLKTKIEVTDNQIQKLQASMTGIEKNNAGHTQNQERQTDHSSTRAEEKNRLGTAIHEDKPDQEIQSLEKQLKRLYDERNQQLQANEKLNDQLESGYKEGLNERDRDDLRSKVSEKTDLVNDTESKINTIEYKINELRSQQSKSAQEQSKNQESKGEHSEITKTPRPNTERHQKTRIAKEFLAIEKELKNPSYLDSQRKVLNEQFKHLETALKDNNIDITQARKKAEVTEQITKQMDEVKKLISKPALKNVTEVDELTKQIVKELPNSDISTTNQRKIKGDLNQDKATIADERSIQIERLKDNVKTVEGLVTEIDQRRTLQETTKLSPMERLDNSRTLEIKTANLKKVIEESKIIMPLVKDKEKAAISEKFVGALQYVNDKTNTIQPLSRDIKQHDLKAVNKPLRQLELLASKVAEKTDPSYLSKLTFLQKQENEKNINGIKKQAKKLEKQLESKYSAVNNQTDYSSLTSRVTSAMDKINDNKRNQGNIIERKFEKNIQQHLDYLKGINMEKSKAIDFDKASESVSYINKHLEKTSFDSNDNRAVKDLVLDKSNQLHEIRLNKQQEIKDNMYKLKDLAKEIEGKKDKFYISSLSATEKLANKREIEGLSKNFSEVSKTIRKDMPAIESKVEKQELRKEIKTIGKEIGIKLSIER